MICWASCITVGRILPGKATRDPRQVARGILMWTPSWGRILHREWGLIQGRAQKSVKRHKQTRMTFAFENVSLFLFSHDQYSGGVTDELRLFAKTSNQSPVIWAQLWATLPHFEEGGDTASGIASKNPAKLYKLFSEMWKIFEICNSQATRSGHCEGESSIKSPHIGRIIVYWELGKRERQWFKQWRIGGALCQWQKTGTYTYP